jgi:hypothetical protein
MNPNPISTVLTAFLTLLLFSSANADEFAGKQWPAKQQVSIDNINHESWNSLLQKYVNDDGMVNYQAWQANKQDRKSLQSYLEQLSKANPTAKAEEKAKLAYWINAYNALTVEGILRVYPTSSIRNHTAKFLGYNIWKNLYLYSGSDKINLDSIEHKVLRKMNEPRIHFAIVCASIGCPRLLNEAYKAEELENQLVTNSTDFFSRSQNLQIDTQKKTVKLSSIMSWFGSDFGDSTSKQIAAISPYFPESAKKFVTEKRFSVSYLDYNWNINEQ